jgi:hypothetical protein
LDEAIPKIPLPPLWLAIYSMLMFPSMMSESVEVGQGIHPALGES